MDAPLTCAAGGERPLTAGEEALARSIFGDAIDYRQVQLKRRRWYVLQPRDVVMAPCGHIHFHPASSRYCDDFSLADVQSQGLLIHEMTHVWQTQQRGRWYLPTRRHPFCRYDYSLKPGWPLERYGIEQQAEIVRHAFMMRNGFRLAGVADPTAYDLLVNFPGAGM